jgi:XisI protein
MDKVKKYYTIVNQLVSEILTDYQSAKNPIVIQPIIDKENGQFLLYHNDWRNERRFYGCFLHLSIAKNGKIWVQHDGTDLIIAEQLLERGVLPEDLVLGFRAPIVRADMGLSVA